MHKIFSVVLFILLGFFLLQTSWAASLVWDYPADYNNIIGWTVYFNDSSNSYNKSFIKTDIVTDEITIDYSDIETKLNLKPGIEYTLILKAYNDYGASGSSNSVVYVVPVYNPPMDSLPSITSGNSEQPLGMRIQ